MKLFLLNFLHTLFYEDMTVHSETYTIPYDFGRFKGKWPVPISRYFPVSKAILPAGFPFLFLLF